VELTVERSRAVLESHWVYLTEACDTCGKLLGAVRYTRRGESGAWCSGICRDGEAAVAQRTVRRKGGRPRKYKNEAEKQKAYRQRQAA
jgi:hypothetical protein